MSIILQLSMGFNIKKFEELGAFVRPEPGKLDKTKEKNRKKGQTCIDPFFI